MMIAVMSLKTCKSYPRAQTLNYASLAAILISAVLTVWMFIMITQIHAVIDQLALDGYIRYSDLGKDYFFLTYKGVHPYKVEWQRIKNFLFTSIFIPIVVSFATTVLTLFVQSLLQ